VSAVLRLCVCSFEECNQYDQAETFGMQAVNMDPTDAWAIHAGECSGGLLNCWIRSVAGAQVTGAGQM